MLFKLAQPLNFLLIAVLLFTCLQPQTSHADEKKDKAARRATLMMQKMKQDMEAEKSAMQAQFDTQKKALEDQLKLKENGLTEITEQLSKSERKAKNLQAELGKTKGEKSALESKLQETQATLESTKTSLADLQTQHTQALADLKFNDNQRKTQSTNLAEATKNLNTCEAKNTKLHAFGTELIKIYDNPSSYNAAMRKEQFFQLKRVELENILQNQQDKLDAEKLNSRKSAF